MNRNSTTQQAQLSQLELDLITQTQTPNQEHDVIEEFHNTEEVSELPLAEEIRIIEESFQEVPPVINLSNQEIKEKIKDSLSKYINTTDLKIGDIGDIVCVKSLYYSIGEPLHSYQDRIDLLVKGWIKAGNAINDPIFERVILKIRCIEFITLPIAFPFLKPREKKLYYATCLRLEKHEEAEAFRRKHRLSLFLRKLRTKLNRLNRKPVPVLFPSLIVQKVKV